MLHTADLEPQNACPFGDSGDRLFSAPAMLWKPPRAIFFEENTKNPDSPDLLMNRLRSNAAQGRRCKRKKMPKIAKNLPPRGLHGMAGAENNRSPNGHPETPLEIDLSWTEDANWRLPPRNPQK